MKKNPVIFMLLVVFAVSIAAHADLGWRGDIYAANDSWSDAGNWGNWGDWAPVASPPTASDVAIVISVDGVTATNVDAPGAVAGTLLVSHNWGFEGTLNIASTGSLDAAAMEVGWNAGVDASVNINGGTLTAGVMNLGSTNAGGSDQARTTLNSGVLNVGTLNMNVWGTERGFLDIYGGVANISTCAVDAGGTITLYGGQLITNAVIIPAVIPNLFDIHDGMLLLAGDKAGEAGWWGEVGIISANGGTGTIQAVYNSDTGYTEVTAVPEPTTLLLLSVGGFLLRRKK